MIIKNNSARPYTVQGIMIAPTLPGQDGTEIPEDKQADVLRDINGIDDLEEVKARAKPGPKAKDD